MKKGLNVVCLGGGIGTMNLLKGLVKHDLNITVIVSMADDGGSAGRLRRAYNVLPSGDIISCLSTLTENELYSKLITYRFPGDRYGKDTALEGQKIGNLLMVAAEEITGSFEGGIALLKKLFNVDANIIPATEKKVALHAKTIDGRVIESEEKIDLGEYAEPRVLEEIFLNPKDAETPQTALTALEKADCIIAGPGDLYTNILPVLVVPAIAKKLKALDIPKIFIINIANKPFETKGYTVAEFIKAVDKHLGSFPFQKIIINNNSKFPIPAEFDYTYVPFEKDRMPTLPETFAVIEADLVDEKFPLYHNPEKLAHVIMKNL